MQNKIDKLEEERELLLEDFARIKILIRANLMDDQDSVIMRRKIYKIASKHSHGIHLSMDEEGKLLSGDGINGN